MLFALCLAGLALAIAATVRAGRDVLRDTAERHAAFARQHGPRRAVDYGRRYGH